jgi:hypothetical protein
MTRRTARALIAMLVLLIAVAGPVTADSQIPDIAARIHVSPSSGPAGNSVTVRGRNFRHECGEQCNGQIIALQFTDAAGVITEWPAITDWDQDGRFLADETIPAGAAAGRGLVEATNIVCGPFGCLADQIAKRVFTVTVQSARGRWPFGGAAPEKTGKTGPVPSSIECTTAPSADANVLMNCPDDSAYPSPEVALAVDPANPSHMVAVSFDAVALFQGTGLATPEFYTSVDGGRSWTNGDVSLQAPQHGGSDPAVSFDARHGTMIASYLDFFIGSNGQECDGDQTVAASSDGGLSWGPPVSVAKATGCLDGPHTSYDKDWLITDNHPRSPHFGRTYLVTSQAICTQVGCTTNDGTLTFNIVEAHSDDGGSTWTTPQVISGSDPVDCTAQPNPPACDNATSAFPAVSPDGSVHVAFEDVQHESAWEPGECCENQYLVVNSKNGGATWSAPGPVIDLEDGSRDFPNCFVDIDGSAYCPLSGTGLGNAAFGLGNLVASPLDGTLYLVFADNRNGIHDSDSPVTNVDVFVMTSRDGGITWTGPDVVSDAPGDQFFPFADVDPITGQLGVVFYDRSYGPSTMFDVTLAKGLPGSFTSTRVTTQSSHFDKDLWIPVHGVQGCEQCVGFVGDYIALAYGSDGRANIAWTDLRRKVSVPHFGSGYTENTFYAGVDG